ncbi:NifB/NifX family molybdenum-iron cluster-binding protein [Thermatribacter velox]|jgi:predicted Fe-Mo cluster-binding NifX family protein|uniref:NifB/NifX family molybdenum-iron cluster-binding protein n=1 Tax=Thermatribacter velox TaxID=3039681 RepID=A0ABZ2Y9Z8_9BACT
MKVAVSATGDSLDSQVDPRLGRARFFIVYDLDKDSFRAVENSFAQASSGAGIQVATFLANEGVEAVITGNVGPNAWRVFQEAGIKVYSGISQVTVREAIQAFREGKLSPLQGPSVGAHFGMGGNFAPPEDVPLGKGPSRGLDGDLEELRKEVNSLKERVEAVERKIEQLRKGGE